MMQTTSHILGYPMPVSLILMSISINPIIFHPIPVSCQDNRLAQTHDEDCLLEAIRVNIACTIKIAGAKQSDCCWKHLNKNAAVI